MASAGDDRERRFDELFSANLDAISEYCRWRSRSAADAEDAVSEVFTTLWRRLEDVPDGDGGRMWLYVTARRVTANHLRSGRRRAGLLERLQTLPVAPGFTERHDADEPAGDLVHSALAAVSPRDREVLLLAEWEQLSPSEIASVVGCTPGSARVRVHRARARFREVFEQLALRTAAASSPETTSERSGS